jgi:hypothetical protein
MTPKKLVFWGLSVSAIFVMALIVIHAAVALLERRIPFVDAILERKSPFLLLLLQSGSAALVATLVVFLFGGTSGKIKLKALGVNLEGPSGPIILWCAVAVSYAAIMVAFIVTR